MSSESTDALHDKAAKRVVVGAQIRELLPDGIRLDEHTLDELDRRVRGMFTDAVGRCTANGRKTVRPCDL